MELADEQALGEGRPEDSSVVDLVASVGAPRVGLPGWRRDRWPRRRIGTARSAGRPRPRSCGAQIERGSSQRASSSSWSRFFLRANERADRRRPSSTSRNLPLPPFSGSGSGIASKRSSAFAWSPCRGPPRSWRAPCPSSRPWRAARRRASRACRASSTASWRSWTSWPSGGSSVGSRHVRRNEPATSLRTTAPGDGPRGVRHEAPAPAHGAIAPRSGGERTTTPRGGGVVGGRDTCGPRWT